MPAEGPRTRSVGPGRDVPVGDPPRVVDGHAIDPMLGGQATVLHQRPHIGERELEAVEALGSDVDAGLLGV